LEHGEKGSRSKLISLDKRLAFGSDDVYWFLEMVEGIILNPPGVSDMPVRAFFNSLTLRG
jgi:hypothetical protein